MAYRTINKDAVLSAIEQTEKDWVNCTFPQIDNRIPSPLCLTIMRESKVPFNSVSSPACTVCPMFFAGFHFLCVSAQNLRFGDISIAGTREFTNLRTIILTKLKSLRKMVENDNKWEDYLMYVAHKKGTSAGRGRLVKRSIYESAPTRKVYRRGTKK